MVVVVGVPTREPRLDDTVEEEPPLSAASCENLREVASGTPVSGPSLELRRERESWDEELDPRRTLVGSRGSATAVSDAVAASKLFFRSAT